VAHPKFREELTTEACRLGLLKGAPPMAPGFGRVSG